MKRNRHAGDVHQLEWSHADPESLLGAFVDRRSRCEAFLQHAHGFGQPREEEAIDDEAVRVARGNRGLAERFLEAPGAAIGRRIGGLPGNDFDEPVLGRMIEVVQANDALGARRRGGQLGDRVGRRVCREDRVRAADLVEALKDALLDLEVFEHRLDHQVGVGQIHEAGCPAQPRRG